MSEPTQERDPSRTDNGPPPIHGQETEIARLLAELARERQNLDTLRKTHEALQREVLEARGRAEDAERTAAQLRECIEALQVGVALHHGDGTISTCNSSMERILGTPRAHLRGLVAGQEPWRMIHEDGSEFSVDAHPARVALREGTSQVGMVMGVYQADGSLRWIEASAVPIGPEGKPESVVTTAVDITKRKVAQATVLHQATLLARAGDAIIAADEHYRITAWNGAAEAMYGWRESEAIGRQGLALLQTEWPGRNAEEMRSQIARTGSWRGEVRQRRKDGSWLPVDITSTVLRDENGEMHGYVSVNRDISERMRLQQALHMSEERYRMTLYGIGDGVTCTDGSGRVVMMNHAAEDLTGWSECEARGRPIDEVFCLIHEETRAGASSPIARVLKEGRVIGLPNTMLVARDGTERHMAESSAPIRDTAGVIVGAVFVFHDQTDERRHQQELLRLNATLAAVRSVNQIIAREHDPARLAEQACRTLVQTGAVTRAWLFLGDGPLTLTTSAGFEADADPALLQRTGDTPPCVVASEHAGPLYGDALDGVCARCPLGGESRCGNHLVMPLARNGRAQRVLGVSLPGAPNLTEEERALLIELANDIDFALNAMEEESRRRQAEERVRAAEAFHESILQSIASGVWVSDRNDVIYYANQSMGAIAGISPEGIVGVNALTGPLGISIERFGAIYREARQKLEPVAYEALPATTQEGRKTLQSGWLIPRLRDGTYDGMIGTVEDITERKRAEEESARLEAQLRHAQKLEALGTLAGGVAHDFNNILGGIMGGLSLLEIDERIPAEYQSDLQGMKELIQRGSHLTKQLLGLGRAGKYDVRPLDLTLVVRDTTAMFARTRRDLTVQIDLAEDLRAVLMDHSQLEQVLLNLFLNAGQAMPGGGRLSVRAENTDLLRDDVQVFDGKPGHFVRLVVADTGVGMDKSTQARIFEPFFTTKTAGHGSGLGLASVYGIIKNHGGMITVESEIEKGATFTILLPATERPVEPISIPKATTSPPRRTILLVDDEEKLLNFSARLLRAMGYDVLVASGGREALEVIRSQGERIWLVILDMIMPDMSGAKTYEALREIAPNLKVLLSSGYSVDGQAQDLLDRGCNGFIQKPFDIGRLSAKLQSLL